MKKIATLLFLFVAWPVLALPNIVLDRHVEDVNQDGCKPPKIAAIAHLLKYGVPVTLADVQQQYSTTGCAVKGTVTENGKTRGFRFEFGGILYFDDGKILACGQQCCDGNFVYCTYEPAVREDGDG
ncbi:hypothetical protein [Gallaecimonas mangrovi]|uniref:hypothetical protein n=1 Tax=Gallaecimonas mangrovi TaxID=2291597 RepID=UPI000E20B9B7|nr:hypothetical protein [Gallaecimonas mangrovi]